MLGGTHGLLCKDKYSLGVTDMYPQIAKLGLHATAALYIGGSIAQFLRINFPLQEIPYVIDWAIVILGSIGAVTLACLTTRIAYRGRWERPVHFIIIIHLTLSVVLHFWAIIVHSHDVFGIFPISYSYFAFLYFLFFSWRSWTIKVRNNDVASNT